MFEVIEPEVTVESTEDQKIGLKEIEKLVHYFSKKLLLTRNNFIMNYFHLPRQSILL